MLSCGEGQLAVLSSPTLQEIWHDLWDYVKWKGVDVGRDGGKEGDSSGGNSLPPPTACSKRHFFSLSIIQPCFRTTVYQQLLTSKYIGFNHSIVILGCYELGILFNIFYPIQVKI